MIAPLQSTFTKLQKTTLFSYLLGKFNLKKKRKKKKEKKEKKKKKRKEKF